jgi:hypothetical protein
MPQGSSNDGRGQACGNDVDGGSEGNASGTSAYDLCLIFQSTGFH